MADKAAQNVDGPLYVDRFLTNFSVNYVQEQSAFLAQRASTVIPVLKQSAKFVVYDRGEFWRDDVQPRPLGGRPVQVSYSIGDDRYDAEEYALETTVDDRQRANQESPINLDQNASRLLTQKHMIRQDRHWAQNLFTAGKWTTQVDGVGSSPGAGQFLQFNDSGSNPILVLDEYIDTMAQATGFKPNTLVLGAKVKRVLRQHPDLIDRIKHTQIGVLDEDILATMFGVKNLITARAVYNSAAEGAANSFQFIADPTSMWLGYIEQTPSLDAPTAIATFAWTGLIPGVTNALGGVMERGRDSRAHSDYFQMRMAWDTKKVADDLGMFFNDVVA